MAPVLFLTVTSVDAAQRIFGTVVVERILPACEVVEHYCCMPSRVLGTVPERYVIRVETFMTKSMIKRLFNYRKRKAPGFVVKVRDKLLKNYSRPCRIAC